ncbi:hypothetical protein PoB_001541700 [Plakobranchus ocellatus]|uniref:Uncharacterized protein n=1 Tax=Plakobranchus ocellatus TaxID=259542 RepID=A0AAV3Z328_9GAST|nr:hypothetical protein PoB_001541700 [Plakobranchus ocellatus]
MSAACLSVRLSIYLFIRWTSLIPEYAQNLNTITQKVTTQWTWEKKLRGNVGLEDLTSFWRALFQKSLGNIPFVAFWQVSSRLWRYRLKILYMSVLIRDASQREEEEEEEEVAGEKEVKEEEENEEEEQKKWFEHYNAMEKVGREEAEIFGGGED